MVCNNYSSIGVNCILVLNICITFVIQSCKPCQGIIYVLHLVVRRWYNVNNINVFNFVITDNLFNYLFLCVAHGADRLCEWGQLVCPNPFMECPCPLPSVLIIEALFQCLLSGSMRKGSMWVSFGHSAITAAVGL